MPKPTLAPTSRFTPEARARIRARKSAAGRAFVARLAEEAEKRERAEKRREEEATEYSAALKTFAAVVASRFPARHAVELRQHAAAMLGLWLATGPTRADGAPRFTTWNVRAAMAALARRVTVETLARRRSFTVEKKWGRAAILRPVRPRIAELIAAPGSRYFLRAPRSLWRAALDACACHCAALDRPHVERAFAPDLAPIIVFPVPLAPVLPPSPTQWLAVARAFIAGTVERHLVLSGSWSRGADFREQLRATADAALERWLAVRFARFPRADCYGVLLRRVARAEAAQVHRFTLWPASLLRAVRRALDTVPVVFPVAVRQTVRVAA